MEDAGRTTLSPNQGDVTEEKGPSSSGDSSGEWSGEDSEGSDSNSSSSSSSSEGEGEDDEPKLKYNWMGASCQDILKADSACCMAVSPKFLALGTALGRVYILDFNGNEIKQFNHHNGRVNDLCVDSTGEYIASAGEDGKVFICPVFSGDLPTLSQAYGSPMLAVALDDAFHGRQKSTRQFACGGASDALILNTKGFLGIGMKSTSIHRGEGPIRCIAWCGTLIAWANDVNVKIYDCRTKQRITYIVRPPNSPPPADYRCCLCWENERSLIIGWADCVKIGRIKERTAATSASLPTRYVELVASFRTDYFICGIAPFGDHLVLLAYSEEHEDDNGDPIPPRPARPELRIVTRENTDISTDMLPIAGFEQYQANDYRLHHMPGESVYYIVSPKVIVVANPRDLNDHIDWLLDRHRYPEALRDAKANQSQLDPHRLVELGERYIVFLLNNGEVAEAAEQCNEWLGRDQQLWEKWIFRFAKIRQLREVSSFIPIANPQLREMVYEMVLNYFLLNDYAGFLNTVNVWPSHLYNIQNIITAVLAKRAKSGDDETLLEALAQLYKYAGQYDQTLHLYLKIKKGDVFQLIQEHNLFASVQDEVLSLVQAHSDQAIALLVNHTERISIDSVVRQLEQHPQLQHAYLRALYEKDVNLGKKYHLLYVRLTAQYRYKDLMRFLRTSRDVPLEKALQVCKRGNLYPEMVFILERMGRAKQALRLIIEEMKDVEQAIEFVQDQLDPTLWDDLITLSLSNPIFIAGLLNRIGAHVDPLKLVKRIPLGTDIPKLRDCLVKIISDYNLQMSLREGCNTILKADCVELMDRLNTAQRRPVKVTMANVCDGCGANVIAWDPRNIEPTVAFFCSHAYHVRCLSGGMVSHDDGLGSDQASESRLLHALRSRPGLLVQCPKCTTQHRRRHQSRE